MVIRVISEGVRDTANRGKTNSRWDMAMVEVEEGAAVVAEAEAEEEEEEVEEEAAEVEDRIAGIGNSS